MIGAEQYLRILGEELRKAREARDLTREQLQALLPTKISTQTIASYELGTRQCSVVRLVELCAALDIEVVVLMGRVEHRAKGFSAREGNLVVPLARIVNEAPAELEPLRRWAALTRVETSSLSVAFRNDMLDRMAALCRIEPPDLLEHLRALSS